jgi:MFS family permease
MFLSLGGIVGSFLAAFLTEYLDPHYSFLICSIMGLCIVASATHLNPSLETPPVEASWKKVRNNVCLIADAAKNPMIYKTLVYFVLCGTMIPSFNDVGYFFTLNVLKFSKFTYSMLTLLSFVSLFCGTMVYNKYFKDFEIRTLF